MTSIDCPVTFDSDGVHFIMEGASRLYRLTMRSPFMTWEDLGEVQKVAEQVLQRSRGMQKRRTKQEGQT